MELFWFAWIWLYSDGGRRTRNSFIAVELSISVALRLLRINEEAKGKI